jgi:hypothetical protein
MLLMGKSTISMAILNGKLLNNKNNNWFTHYSYWKLPFIVDFPIKNGDFP